MRFAVASLLMLAGCAARPTDASQGDAQPAVSDSRRTDAPRADALDAALSPDAPVSADAPRFDAKPSSPDVPVAIDAPRVDVGCEYEPVTLDAAGQPRNAMGHIRHCWPGEPRCVCDRDDDCYAEAGYTPRCAPGPRDAGAPRPDVVAPPVDIPLPPIDLPRPGDTGPLPGNDPVTYAGSFPTTAGRRTVSLRVNGNAREVVVYVPSARGGSPPLMLLFHGTNGSGGGILDESDAQRVADANGAIVVAPSSRYMSRGDWDHRTEETYWETYPNADPTGNEDLLLTRACIAEARARYNVDAGRVYALGHSNGGMFATVVATVLADRIAAFATSSAGLNRCANTWSCSFQGAGTTCAALRARGGWCNCAGTPKPIAPRTDGRMPPGYLAHGTEDPMVSVQYTCEQEALMSAAGAFTQVVLRSGDGHVLPGNFVAQAWTFLSRFRR